VRKRKGVQLNPCGKGNRPKKRKKEGDQKEGGRKKSEKSKEWKTFQENWEKVKGRGRKGTLRRMGTAIGTGKKGQGSTCGEENDCFRKKTVWT